MGDDKSEALRAWAAARWPRVDWTGAEVRQGAFHQVVLSRGAPIMRGAVGNGHPARSAREAAIARVVAGLGLTTAVPSVLDGPLGDEHMTAILISRVPGVHGADRDWNTDLAVEYQRLLDQLTGVDTSRLEVLPEVRSWCGGQRWPEIVQEVTVPLPRRLRALADRLVAAVLDVEADQPGALVHGDFGPHNVLWDDGRAVSLIDFDHACVADRAIDVAPLIGVYGAAAVAEMVDEPLLTRAMHHRATLSLQVACGAHLIGEGELRDFALSNYVSRAAAGLLHDPAGATPGG
ncbi:aminoglycoside phosphotransferase family protein [Desertihabitans aurantiacus]|uniref:aminoglycoside phosphotransferase family protein n=1 Tax=Desertihabitans aurantiacus TaxID=2282477 RepID=UPI000DF74D09|nr:aminoglycoside phosphotransferase family protein [Desertihabitans aurantiacus]